MGWSSRSRGVTISHALISAAVLVTAVSCVPYVIDVARGKTRPNLVTWGLWALLSSISAVAAVSAGAVPTAIQTGTAAATNVAIFVMSIRKGVRKYGWFDIACLIAAVAGLAGWQLTGDPSVAIALSISVIAVAALPTWRHAWLEPFAETWQGFALGALAAVLTLLSLTRLSFAAIAFPVFAAGNCLVMVALILSRRRLASAERGAQVVQEVAGGLDAY